MENEEEKQVSDGEIILNPDGQNPSGQNPNNRRSNYYGGGSAEPYDMHSELHAMHGNAYFEFFPPGYRFKPYDHELVVNYLRKKILNERLPPNRIQEVELYKRNPQYLAENYTAHGDNEWYFFTPRDRKYKNGERPNRSAGDGYWKATGADRPVNHNGVQVGSRKALVFYKGKPPKGNKTDWIMHEFRVENPPKRKRPEFQNDMRLDDWVLCRLYKKVDKNSKGPGRPRDGRVQDQEPENEVPPQFQDRGQMPIVEEPKMLPQECFNMPEGLDSFEQIFNPFNQANPMGLYHFDNSPFLHGCQSGFIGGSQSLYSQLAQNPMIHHMIPGHHQNLNLMFPAEPFSSADNIKYEQFNDYHSDDLLNIPPLDQGNNTIEQMVSSFRGAPNSVIPPFSDDRGASSSVISPSFNDDKKLKKQKRHL
ncbi:NAC domain-containing protein 2-like [Pistacia vera]|uniref:NAC domain-containing protein 2-like n=1 Tax=Pistacia vera TaxID=55513 RepID=UPI0012633602|nr:NAC domain-containing protein 2-like [Pistacia vera]